MYDVLKTDLMNEAFEKAMSNQDNYDNDGIVIDDYVAADVYIDLSQDDYGEKISDDEVNDYLEKNGIHQSSIMSNY
tara:strand:+ start:391 stop:618 length:228 start_codon:yes stop_codon:yes gene_type:complete